MRTPTNKYLRYAVVDMGIVDLFGAAAIIVSYPDNGKCSDSYYNFSQINFHIIEDQGRTLLGARMPLLDIKTPVDLAKIGKKAFVKMVAGDCGNDLVVKSALELSHYLKVPVRVVPSKTSDVQMSFIVLPGDTKEEVATKAENAKGHPFCLENVEIPEVAPLERPGRFTPAASPFSEQIMFKGVLLTLKF